MKKSIRSLAAVCGILLTGAAMAQIRYPWMSPEVAAAWQQGYRGQGVTITVVDDFSSASKFSGNMGLGSQNQRHGQWTLQEAGMVAPSASLATHDFGSNGGTVRLKSGLNVLNLSYALYGPAGYSLYQVGWTMRERSIIGYATSGLAVVAKAAGNDAVAIGSASSSGTMDYLNLALKGTQSTIYAGALSRNGTTAAPASMAWYSNTAGKDRAVQNQFLVVGVDSGTTGLYGTSFAAPIISGYAAILGSKFTRASPTQITNQLLNTARKDTLVNYNPETYGRGEASLTRALAPVAIR